MAALAVAGLCGTAAAGPAAAAPAGDRTLTSYLVRVDAGALPAVAGLVQRVGGSVRDRLVPLDTLLVDLPASAAARLRADARVASVSEDGKVGLLESGPTGLVGPVPNGPGSMYTVQTVMGARALWPAGAGAGVDVALIDSGVARVPGLDEPGKVVDGPDLSSQGQSLLTRSQDTFGHGTHMASIIAGHDAGTEMDDSYDATTDYQGMAPGARVVSVRVAGATGATDVSQVIAGISWVVQHAQDGDRNIRVLSLSFGTDSLQPYQIDPLAHAAEVAWRNGIVVVTAAGNDGAGADGLMDPAKDPFVLAVGADDTRGTPKMDDDVMAPFSSSGDGTRNPDVVAPGVHVQGLIAPGSTVDRQGTAGQYGGRYQRGSGTSQATAVMAGAAALLLGARPNLTPDQVKALLVLSSRRLPTADTTLQGAGLPNLKKALTAAVGKGTQSWPRSNGTGSLEAARGSAHIEDDGVELSGEVDVFGNAYDSAVVGPLTEAGTSWQTGRWNGTAWSVSNPLATDWSGSTWLGSTWLGSTWLGSTWLGSTWLGSTWLSQGWS